MAQDSKNTQGNKKNTQQGINKKKSIQQNKKKAVKTTQGSKSTTQDIKKIHRVAKQDTI